MRILTFTAAGGAERSVLSRAIRDSLSSARALAKKEKTARLQCTLGSGSELWDRLSPATRPAGLRQFRAVTANGRVAPATGGDLFLQITSGRHDLNLDLAMGLARRLQPLATMTEEIPRVPVSGFTGLDRIHRRNREPQGKGQGRCRLDWGRGPTLFGW